MEYTNPLHRQSAAEQAEALKKMATDLGAKVLESKGTDAITELLEKAASGEVKEVLVSQIERLAPTPEEAKSILAKFNALGVKVTEA